MNNISVNNQFKFSELPYERADFEQFAKDFHQKLNDFAAADNFISQSEVLAELVEMRNMLETNMSLAHVRYSINTKDEFYDAEVAFIDEMSPKYGELVKEYYQTINESKFKKELAEKFDNQLFKIAELYCKTTDEKIRELIEKENKLGTEYQKLMASAQIEFEGKTYNLSGLAKFTQSPDRDLRKRATEAREQFYIDNQTKLDDIYDQLVKLRHQQAVALGYENYIQMAYDRFYRYEYGPKEVAVFRNNILDVVTPYTETLVQKQSERLGISPLQHYDLGVNFKSGNATPKGDPEWILNNGKVMYDELSAETKEFFNFMTRHELLDLVTRDGKAGGGYCTMFPSYKAPFIFSNFNGTSHDIDVLTHEAGHAFQVYQSRNFEVSEYYWPTYEACEIHSMSMEFFTWRWMESFFKEDTAKYKFKHLEGALRFMPYGCLVDEFQHEVYSKPEMTPAERNATWRRLEKKYLPHKNYGENQYLENGGFWQRQSHIYQSPFYYIDYVLAQICALQFWLRMQNNFEDAWNDYLTLCKAGGSKPFLQLVKLAGLKSPFDKETLITTLDGIKKYLNTIDDSKL